MPADDGAAFYAKESIATVLYDRLFASPSTDGDLAFYGAFARRTGPRILDAACGTGWRASPDRARSMASSSPITASPMSSAPPAGPPASRAWSGSSGRAAGW